MFLDYMLCQHGWGLCISRCSLSISLRDLCLSGGFGFEFGYVVRITIILMGWTRAEKLRCGLDFAANFNPFFFNHSVVTHHLPRVARYSKITAETKKTSV